jgi:hypothetical protein
MIRGPYLRQFRICINQVLLSSGNAGCDQLFDSAGACAAGEIWTGALAGAGGAGGFFAAVFLPFAGSGGGAGASDAIGGAPVCVDGRGGTDAFALSADGGGRDPGAAVPVPGSGVMMLTAGVFAALGNSALVGRPVGTAAPSRPPGAAGAGATCGMFQDGA